MYLHRCLIFLKNIYLFYINLFSSCDLLDFQNVILALSMELTCLLLGVYVSYNTPSFTGKKLIRTETDTYEYKYIVILLDILIVILIFAKRAKPDYT